jgi:hypothetical protein
MVAMCLNMSKRTVKPQESNQKPHMIELTVRIASAGHCATVCMHLWAGIVEHVTMSGSVAASQAPGL